MNIKTLFYISILSIGLAAFLQGCGAAGSDDTIISGEVINSSNGEPIPGAVVRITSPQEYVNDTETDSSGKFSFGLNLNEAVDITLSASKQGFIANELSSFPVSPESGVTNLTIELDEQTTDGQDPDDQGGVGGESGGAASIILVNVQRSSISVQGTGGEVHSAFTFAVKDSAGRRVDQRTAVSFNIIRGPDGGENISPKTGFTNPENGEITANLASGDSSGTVRLEAVIERPNVGLTIRSTPVLISIASGFPVAERFNVGPKAYNFDAYAYIREDHTNPITASVGDLKGNPVKEGTAVYFSASNGGLVNGSATTNANGYATVNLSANGSSPSDHPMGEGFIDVVAQTVDKDNNYIEEKITLLLTTPEAIITVTDPNTGTVNPSLNIGNGESQTFDVSITDLNGYPLAAGTSISVETGQGLSASGGITDLKLGDYFNPGQGKTEFQVTISDSNPDESTPSDGSFTIRVETPSGVVTTRDISGSRAKM